MVEGIPVTVGRTPRVFITKGGAVRGTMLAQRAFTARTSRVLSSKQVTVRGTKDVERVDGAVGWAAGILTVEV